MPQPTDHIRLRTAQAELRAGASLAEAAQVAGCTSVVLFAWRYYGAVGHWPTQDQPRPDPSR